MTDPIEAMARAMAENGGTDCWEHALECATAAYNALRNTLVPVGWKYECDKRGVRWSVRTSLDAQKGWNAFPVFTLPELPHDQA